MAQGPLILWFRLDLRINDNPALHQAIETGRPILPIYIWAPEEESPWAPGAASRVWLHGSLKALDSSLKKIGSPLFLFSGKTINILSQLASDLKAYAVYWNRRYEPKTIERDSILKSFLEGKGLEVKTFNSHLLVEPWELHTKAGTPYQVFTPFWRALRALPISNTLPIPQKRLVQLNQTPQGLSLDSLKLLPTINWDSGIQQSWVPGEAAAQKSLKLFIDENLHQYEITRDHPARDGTSKLSPHLHFGELSPRQIWHQVTSKNIVSENPLKAETKERFLRELAWREFAYHLLFHFPKTTEQPLKSKFLNFPWRSNAKDLKAWQQGRTGFPLVDAGMRELWHTGYMHNRVRMLVASFLVKDLRINWLQGARWFWETLVDADLANNTLGWQWCTGCGADASPYFRIFNPSTQAKKFDPQGNYIRKYVPELQAHSIPEIFTPWQFQTNGVKYPKPIVDHTEARLEALNLYQALSKKP